MYYHVPFEVIFILAKRYREHTYIFVRSIWKRKLRKKPHKHAFYIHFIISIMALQYHNEKSYRKVEYLYCGSYLHLMILILPVCHLQALLIKLHRCGKRGKCVDIYDKFMMMQFCMHESFLFVTRTNFLMLFPTTKLSAQLSMILLPCIMQMKFK
jgi:hypothetical protein